MYLIGILTSKKNRPFIFLINGNKVDSFFTILLFKGTLFERGKINLKFEEKNLIFKKLLLYSRHTQQATKYDSYFIK